MISGVAYITVKDGHLSVYSKAAEAIITGALSEAITSCLDSILYGINHGISDYNTKNLIFSGLNIDPELMRLAWEAEFLGIWL